LVAKLALFKLTPPEIRTSCFTLKMSEIVELSLDDCILKLNTYNQTMIKKCENLECEEEYNMHTGSNVCPKCGERTFVPAEETNSK